MDDIRAEEEKLKTLVQKILDRALSFGATDAEVSVGYAAGQSVDVRLGEIDRVEHYLDKEATITVFVGQKRGVSTTADLSSVGLEKAVIAALDIAKYTQEDPCAGLPDKKNLLLEFDLKNQEALGLYVLPKKEKAKSWSIDGLAERAIDCERLGLALYPEIKNSDGASSGYYLSLSVLGNTRGFLGVHAGSKYRLDCSLVAEKNQKMQRESGYSIAIDPEDLASIEEVAKEAAFEARSKLDARQIKTQEAPVVFRNDVARSLVGHYLSAVSGGALYRKQSFLLNLLGEKIFPDFFNLYEDPFVRKGWASCLFDAEGGHVFKAELVKNGCVKSYLLSSYAARKLNMQPTGHTGGAHNLFLKPTEENLDLKKILKKMQRGLLVTDLIGQGVNLTTGDYSRGASGFWIEGGEIAYPVEEIMIASNLKTMFKNISAVGADADLRSSIQTGAILLPSMMIAGG